MDDVLKLGIKTASIFSDVLELDHYPIGGPTRFKFKKNLKIYRDLLNLDILTHFHKTIISFFNKLRNFN